MSAEPIAVEVPKPVRLDLGCGKNPREGFTGVDIRDFGQEIKADLTQKWPWDDDSVDEVHCSHFVEHLSPLYGRVPGTELYRQVGHERIHFVNELYRVLKPGAKCQLVVPHWASTRAYGDLTHCWPAAAEFWFYYLSKKWREENAPHNDGYTCDFEATWGYSLRQDLMARNQEYQQYAIANFKEAAQDIVITMTKRVENG